MAKRTIEKLEGYRWAVVRRDAPVFDNGMPVFNGSGEQKTHEMTVLVFVAADDLHIVEIELDEHNRGELVKGLTGGIILA